VEHAMKKLKAKNLDFIVLNSLRNKGAGFGHVTNKVSIIDKSGKLTSYKLKSKNEVAEDIVNRVTALLNA
jgi:phosphopantothenoylcysteine decarboxylase/phosphopantothenate--cysteine ligase